MIFRIDDVSVNTNMRALGDLLNTIRLRQPNVNIMLAVSPLVHDVSKERDPDDERAFPRRMSAMSDHRNLFRVQKSGVPDVRAFDPDTVASHGLVHVDHRLMGREAQELSIVTSCSLLGADTFVPPFNKYNKDTIDICDEHNIKLIKFEDGWQHVRFNNFDRKHQLYYLHTHDTNAAFMEKWLA